MKTMRFEVEVSGNIEGDGCLICEVMRNAIAKSVFAMSININEISCTEDRPADRHQRIAAVKDKL